MSFLKQDILIDVAVCEKRLALMENGEAVEIQIERPFPERLVGNIYRAKVNSVLPGMQAAFVDIGLDKNAFLYAGDVVPKSETENEGFSEESEALRNFRIQDFLKAGQEITVQVIKEALGTKGPRVTTNISLPGRYLVLMPKSDHIGVSRRIQDEEERLRLNELAKKLLPDGFGVIMRTVAEGISEDELQNEISNLCRISSAIDEKNVSGKVPRCIHKDSDLVARAVRDYLSVDVDRMVINDKAEYKRILELVDVFAPGLKNKIHLYSKSYNMFDFYGVGAAIESIRERKVWLKSGGYIVIDKTEALTVIDVNTGKYTGSTSLEETVFKTNMEAAKEIPYQLRLRDIGGIIVVDFIDMKTDANQNDVLELLRAEIKKDRTKTAIIGLTGLGLVEITRKKVKQEVNFQLGDDCNYCGGTGKITSTYVVVRRVETELEKFFVFNPHGRVKVEIHPSIVSVINARGGELANVMRNSFGRLIDFSGNSLLGYEEIRIRVIEED